AAPEDSAPRIKPTAERAIDFRSGMAELYFFMPIDDEEFAYLPRFAITPDGKTLIQQDLGGKLTLWDTATGKRVAHMVSNRRTCFARPPDGKSLAMVSRGLNYSGGDSVELYALAKRKVTRRLDDGANRMTFTAVAFSPDGKTLALGASSGQYGYAE